MHFITCEEECSLVQLAHRHHVHHRDLWLPLDAALPSRAAKGAHVTVAANTPLALLDHAPQVLSFDKRSICQMLNVRNSFKCEDEAVDVNPLFTPPGCTVFVRWDSRGTKRVRAATRVLHYIVEKEKSASSSCSSATAAGVSKRSRAETEGSVNTASFAETLRGKQHRLSLLQRSTEDLQRRLSAVMQSQGRPLNARSLHIFTSTLANIRQRSAKPPLHFVLSENEDSLEAGGVRWVRTNRRVLSRVFRGSSSEERSEVSKYSDGSRRVRFYFIEDVLLCRSWLWKAVRTSEVEQGNSSTDNQGGTAEARCAPSTSLAAINDDVKFLLRDKVLADMNSYAERGYRIVFLEHYSILHHASRFTVEKTLGPVVQLYQTCCPHLTVTVVLSAMSYVTATRRQGMELSLVMPQAGLLQFFVAEMNTALQPDAKTACVVGSDARGNSFLNSLHREFARNASLAYVDVSELP